MKSGGSWIRVKKGNFTKKNRFLEANFRKCSISSGNFTKKFRFFEENFRKISFFRKFKKKLEYPGKNWPFTATSWQIIIFLFKGHHFRTYFLHMIRYNNISGPVHAPPAIPLPKNWGSRPSQPPRIDATELNYSIQDK